MKTKLNTSIGIVTPKRANFEQSVALESGVKLRDIELIYETYGDLNKKRNNAILICHALSGNHHAAGYHSKSDKKPGWWDALIGPEKAIQAHLHNSKIFKSNVEDSAHIVIEYTTGIIANIYLDMLSKPKERKIYINGTKGSVFLDLIKNEFKFKKNNQIEWTKINNNFNNLQTTYIDEMKHFIKCVKNKKQTMINLKEGIETLKVVLAAKSSSKRKNIVKIS